MQDISLSISRTLAIDRIPRSVCSKENIMAHFKEVYPDFKILVSHLLCFTMNMSLLVRHLKFKSN